MKKAEATRLYILERAFDLVYKQGYQNTSIDHIIDTTEVTKGAFYYHFKTKDDMGLALIKELLKPAMVSSFKELSDHAHDPLKAIYDLMYKMLIKDNFFKVAYGCPAANLTQEMTPWHPTFSVVLNELKQQWIKAVTSTIEHGKLNGSVRKNVNAKQVAIFLVSGYWGARNVGKLENSKKPYLLFLKELKYYLDSLK